MFFLPPRAEEPDPRRSRGRRMSERAARRPYPRLKDLLAERPLYGWVLAALPAPPRYVKAPALAADFARRAAPAALRDANCVQRVLHALERLDRGVLGDRLWGYAWLPRGGERLDLLEWARRNGLDL